MLLKSRKILVNIFYIITIACIYGLLYFINDNESLSNKYTFNNSRAVLTIRDSAESYEQFFTEYFTKKYFMKSYNESVYVNLKSKIKDKNFVLASLVYLLEKYDQVDVFILAHTNKYSKWVDDIPSNLRTKIRLVYNSGCKNAFQSEDWVNNGVTSYVGHKGETSLSPIFFYYFLRRWINGYNLENAVNASNQKSKQSIKYIDKMNFNDSDLSYVEQTEAHLFGQRRIIIDIKP